VILLGAFFVPVTVVAFALGRSGRAGRVTLEALAVGFLAAGTVWVLRRWRSAGPSADGPHGGPGLVLASDGPDVGAMRDSG
jgi:hypothetical protein